MPLYPVGAEDIFRFSERSADFLHPQDDTMKDALESHDQEIEDAITRLSRNAQAFGVAVGTYADYNIDDGGPVTLFTGDTDTGDTFWTAGLGPYPVPVPIVSNTGQLAVFGLAYTIDVSDGTQGYATYGFILDPDGSYTDPANWGPNSGAYHHQQHGSNRGVTAWRSPTFTATGNVTQGGVVMFNFDSTDLGTNSLYPGKPVLNIVILGYTLDVSRAVARVGHFAINLGPALN